MRWGPDEWAVFFFPRSLLVLKTSTWGSASRQPHCGDNQKRHLGRSGAEDKPRLRQPGANLSIRNKTCVHLESLTRVPARVVAPGEDAE